jgi:hypothetical protein
MPMASHRQRIHTTLDSCPLVGVLAFSFLCKVLVGVFLFVLGVGVGTCQSVCAGWLLDIGWSYLVWWWWCVCLGKVYYRSGGRVATHQSPSPNPNPPAEYIPKQDP